MKKINLVVFLCFLFGSDYLELNASFFQNPIDSVDKARVEFYLAKLTTEQKANIVVGNGMNLPGISVMEGEDKVPGAAGSTYAAPNLGIPSIILADGPAGLRIQPKREGTDETYYCTAFPIATLLASTWDTKLVQEIGEAFGEEVKQYGVDILLAPAMNIHRNPLAGRNFEYYSEDPVVSGLMGAAMVNGVESKEVGTSVKHFAANNSETNRMLINTHVSERALREIYLRGFEIVVKESQPWTVMSSYNKINGVYTSQNAELLETILRGEWGFEGLVMTDWFAGNDPVAQMKAGNDLIMPGTKQHRETILAAVRNGELPEAILDRNVSRILYTIIKSPAYKRFRHTNNPNLKEHAEIARRAAAEGTILLKNNENVLPLPDGDLSVSTFGVGSYDFIAGGTGSGDVNEAYTVSLVEGLENAGIKVRSALKDKYLAFMDNEKAKLPKKEFFFQLLPPIPEMPLGKLDVIKEASESDIALITIGRNSGEFQDRKQEGDFYLTDAEKSLIKIVSEGFHKARKKVVVLLNIGNVIETASWKDMVDGIVLGWQGGQEAGNALTDVLTGKVNPSGKLATTFPVSYDDVPGSATFPGKELENSAEKMVGAISLGKDSEITYDEGIMVGYRYYTTNNVKVSFPFGFGKSYTDFAYENLKLSSPVFDDKITIEVDVKNSGTVEGKESVQVYVSAPGKDMMKPVLELKSFGMTGLLQPNEQQTLTFTLSAKDLASFDTARTAWVVEPGNYKIHIGASVEDLKLSQSFAIPAEIMVEKVNKVLVPAVVLKN